MTVGKGTTWKSAEWQGARFLQTQRLKAAVCLRVLASPSMNQIIGNMEDDQQRCVCTTETGMGGWEVTVV